MRVLQLIDSLEPGGAERLSVTLANSLYGLYGEAYFCATRKEGILKEQLAVGVKYLFLKKGSSVDIKALMKLRSFILDNKIEVVHAHGTSFFIGTQIKMLMPGIKLVWHEHHGARIEKGKKKSRALQRCSRFFDHIITVNNDLKSWWSEQASTRKVTYLPNFVEETELMRPLYERNKEIVYAANLRIPKNHELMVEAFALISNEFPNWQLKFIGTDFEDDYSKSLMQLISSYGLEKRIRLTGRQSDMPSHLNSASVGVISSDSEGLPMVLLEYGIAGLAVVSTDVGQCSAVISNFGLVVPKQHPKSMAKALQTYMSGNDFRINTATEFRRHIISNYSESAILPQLEKIYQD